MKALRIALLVLSATATTFTQTPARNVVVISDSRPWLPLK